NDTNMQYTNLTPEISTDFYNDLNLVDFKDFYYLNGYVYLRARLLSGNENTHLSIGIIDPISGKFNGALIYNKESDSSLVDGEFSTLEQKQIIEGMRNIKNNELIKFNSIDLYELFPVMDKSEYNEYRWMRIK